MVEEKKDASLQTSGITKLKERVTKLPKITLWTTVGAVALMVGTGIGIGISSAIFSKTEQTATIKLVKLEQLPPEGEKLPVMMVTDGGTVDDKTFNEQAYLAFSRIDNSNSEDAINEALYGVDSERFYIQPSSDEPADLINAYRTAITTLGRDTVTNVSGNTSSTNKKVLVVTGNKHKDAIFTFKQENPDDDTKFLFLDDGVDNFGHFPDDQPLTGFRNTYWIKFYMGTVAFQAGYLSALYLEAIGDTTPTLGAWAAQYRPNETIDIFLGFIAGVRYYNENKAADKPEVTFVRFSDASKYTDAGFERGEVGRSNTNHMIDGGADIIFPIAGKQIEDAIDEIKKSDRANEIKVIGMSNNLSKEYQDDKEMLLTSVKKNVRKATIEGYKALTGLSNNLGEAEETEILTHSPTTKLFMLGQEKGFVNYVEQYSASTKVGDTEVTWGDLYKKVRSVPVSFMRTAKVSNTITLDNPDAQAIIFYMEGR